MRSSGTNFLFWFGMICYGTVKIRSLILIASDDVRIPPTPHPSRLYPIMCVCRETSRTRFGLRPSAFSTLSLLWSLFWRFCQSPSPSFCITLETTRRWANTCTSMCLCVCSSLWYVCTCVQRKPSPYETATFLSQLTWWWQNGQIWTGWRRPLRHADLPNLNHVDMSKNVAPRFQKNLDQELKRVG